MTGNEDAPGRPLALPETISLNASQKTLWSWLSRKEQALAEIYLGAHRLLVDNEPPGWSRFFGHAIRELVNKTIDVELGPERSRRLDYASLVKPVAERWIEERPAEWARDLLPPAKPTTVPISWELANAISLLSDEHAKKTDTLRVRLHDFFRSIYEDEEITQPRLAALANRWMLLRDWANGQAKDLRRSDSGADPLEFREKLRDYEGPLLPAITDMFATMSELNVILEEANERSD